MSFLQKMNCFFLPEDKSSQNSEIIYLEMSIGKTKLNLMKFLFLVKVCNVDYSSVVVSSMVKIDLPMQVLDCINLLKKA